MSQKVVPALVILVCVFGTAMFLIGAVSSVTRPPPPATGLDQYCTVDAVDIGGPMTTTTDITTCDFGDPPHWDDQPLVEPEPRYYDDPNPWYDDPGW